MGQQSENQAKTASFRMDEKTGKMYAQRALRKRASILPSLHTLEKALVALKPGPATVAVYGDGDWLLFSGDVIGDKPRYAASIRRYTHCGKAAQEILELLRAAIARSADDE